MDLAITLFVVFIILPGLFLFIFVYLPKRIRSWRLESLAKKYGLSFDNSMQNLSIAYESYKRNLITGSIKGHSLSIFDSYELKHVMPASVMGLRPRRNRTAYYDRKTIFMIDGKPTTLIGNFSSFASPHKIAKKLWSI